MILLRLFCANVNYQYWDNVIPKGNKILKKNIQKFLKCLKTRPIKVIKPIIEDKTANQIVFACSRQFGVSVITETDLEFAEISLRLANVQKIILQKLFL